MIAARFMDIARSKLDHDTFDQIHSRAVELEREAILAAPHYSAKEVVDKPRLAENTATALAGLRHRSKGNPHVVQRLQDRGEIEVTKHDLADLERIVREGGSDVQIIKQEMLLIKHCRVSWRGKHFVVVYDYSKNKLVTAWLYVAKSKRKMNKSKMSNLREPARQHIKPHEVDIEEFT